MKNPFKKDKENKEQVAWDKLALEWNTRLYESGELPDSKNKFEIPVDYKNITTIYFTED